MAVFSAVIFSALVLCIVNGSEDSWQSEKKTMKETGYKGVAELKQNNQESYCLMNLPCQSSRQGGGTGGTGGSGGGTGGSGGIPAISQAQNCAQIFSMFQSFFGNLANVGNLGGLLGGSRSPTSRQSILQFLLGMFGLLPSCDLVQQCLSVLSVPGITS